LADAFNTVYCLQEDIQQKVSDTSHLQLAYSSLQAIIDSQNEQLNQQSQSLKHLERHSQAVQSELFLQKETEGSLRQLLDI